MSSEGIPEDLAIYPRWDIQNFALLSDLYSVPSPRVYAERALPL